MSVLELPIEIPHFPIGQYWHDRFHADPGNRWLRGVFARLYGRQGMPETRPFLTTEAFHV